METEFSRASWISRAVGSETRIQRAIRRDGLESVAPGHEIAQSFRALGPVIAVNVDIAGPQDVADPYAADVAFTLLLRNSDGLVVAERTVEGPQLVWEYFGQMLEPTTPAPPGVYEVVLRPSRHVIGWYLQSGAGELEGGVEDDGVSPLEVDGIATRDGAFAVGTRLIGVETVPAPNPVFQNEIEISKPVASAVLSAAVLGVGFVSINQRGVGSEVVEPAVSDYDKSVYFRKWDVTHLLSTGRNVIRIDAGRERWAARGGDIWGWNLAPWHREPAAIAQLEVRYADGTTETFSTDQSWLTKPSEVVREEFFLGETWVARATELAWEAACVVAAPRGRLRLAQHPGVTARPPIAAVTTSELESGSVVYDFGVVMTGRIRLTVSARPGAQITVVTGEARARSGAVVCDNTLVAGDGQRDRLRVEREVDEFVWEPQFGYRGFRWAQIDVEGDAEASVVQAIPLYTPLTRVGEMSASEPLLQWIDGALGLTFLNNMHGIPTDTPIYEKNGWTADAHLATEALLHHFDLRASFTKWMDDHVDAQREDGAIPWIVPTPGWGRDSDPAWSISAALIPWYMYLEYGDVDLLKRYESMIVAFADNLIDRGGTGLWPDRSWGDWVAPGFGVGPEGMVPLGTILAVATLQTTAAVLNVLGEPSAEHYSSIASDIAASYHEAYFDSELGHYAVPGVGYRQVLNILPLAFDTVPLNHVGTVRASLIDDLEHRTAGHLDCGAIGVRYLLPVLEAAGRDDLALTVLLQRTLPGWGAWFDRGERTLVETWDIDARSRNHYFLGSVASWIQQRVGGIRMVEPGWRRFEVRPVADERVNSGKIAHRSPHGVIAVEWNRGPGGWLFDVDVPASCSAVIIVPSGQRELAGGRHHVRLH